MRTTTDELAALRTATRTHYERYPFIEGGRRRVDLWKRRLSDLFPADLAGARVLDVGASTGEVARALADHRAKVTCVELTEVATRRCKVLHADAVQVVQADALALPFPDATFDHAMAIGVLHHTPDCGFALREMARVTRPGGTLVVLLYSKGTPYHALFALTKPLRRRWPADVVDSLPRWGKHCLRLVLRVHTGLWLDDALLRRLVADQLWTPQATFHAPREVERLGRECGLRLVRRKSIALYSNIFIFERGGS